MGVTGHLSSLRPRSARRGEAAQRRGRSDRAALLAARSRAPRPLPPPARQARRRARAASGGAAARALDGCPDGGPRGDPAPPPPLRRRDVAQGARRHLELRPRPATGGGQPWLRLSRPVLGPRAPGRGRRAHRGHGRSSGGSRKARADRRPRPVLVAALRLRAPDRRPRLLRVGIQRAGPGPAELRAHEPDQPSAHDGGLEGGRGRGRGGALPEAARSDHGGRARDLAGRLRRARRLRRRGRRRGPRWRHSRRLPAGGREGDGEAAVAAPAALSPGVRD